MTWMRHRLYKSISKIVYCMSVGVTWKRLAYALSGQIRDDYENTLVRLCLSIGVIQNLSFRLHAVSRILHGSQRESSVKTLRSLFSADSWRHCVLSGRTQRRALPRHQSEEMEI